jgi:hypothetical protein
MRTIYITQKIRQDTLKRLRKYERQNKLKPSISNTIDSLLRLAELTGVSDEGDW